MNHIAASVIPIGFVILAYFMLFKKIFSTAVTAYHRRYRSHDTPGASVLLAHYIDVARLAAVQRGHIGSLEYSAIATIPPSNGQQHAALLYRVVLPYATKIHLLGIPKNKGTTQLHPAYGKSILEKVDLEGDFNDYFSLYCDHGMQTLARYVLDPKAMGFIVDFCQSQDWEIVGNELYFVQAGGFQAPNDPTNMFDDIEHFVNQIRPAVETPLTDAQRAAHAPYGEDLRTDLKCPICAAVMKNTGSYFVCPENHGVLVTGAILEKVMDGDLTISMPDRVVTVARTDPLTCPSCGSTMSRLAYNGGEPLIDSCPRCPYRWLDNDEAVKRR